LLPLAKSDEKIGVAKHYSLIAECTQQ